MTLSDTVSPRMVTHRMMEKLANAKAAEAATEEKTKRGRKPKAPAGGVEASEIGAKAKRGRPKKENSEERSTAKTTARKGKRGPKPKAAASKLSLVLRKKPGPKPKAAAIAVAKPRKKRQTKGVGKTSAVKSASTRRGESTEAVVTMTITGSAAAIRRALADLQG